MRYISQFQISFGRPANWGSYSSSSNHVSCKYSNILTARGDQIYSDSIRIRIFFLKSRIFGFGFDNFWAWILFEYSNLFPRISNIWNIFSLLILKLNWEFLGALATCWSHLRALMDKTCAWMWLSLDTFMRFLNMFSQFLLSAFYFPHFLQI